MGNLDKYLSEQTKTVSAIYAYWKELGDSKQRPINSLGASLLGHPCERYLWYLFRHCCKPTFDGRMYRLFNRGHVEEPRMLADLRAIGCTVHEVNEATSEQFAVSALGGHLTAHLDGCVLGVPEAPKTWHVLEFKTHKAKAFRELIKKGLLGSNPKYHAQVMIEMHLTGMERALYLAINKDTEELYSERIRYDKRAGASLMERAKRIITSTEPPVRISTKPDYYQCRFCDAKVICFGSLPPGPALPVPYLSCRQCCHATPNLDSVNAGWDCEKHCAPLGLNEQLKPCKDHLVLPILLLSEVPEDHGQDAAGNDYICFAGEWGQWKHGKGMVTSEELTIMPIPMFANGIIKLVKERFGAQIVMECNLIDKYITEEGAGRLIWRGKASELEHAWKREYDDSPFQLEPTARIKESQYIAVEYTNNRLIVAYPLEGIAQIWEKTNGIQDCQTGSC